MRIALAERRLQLKEKQMHKARIKSIGLALGIGAVACVIAVLSVYVFNRVQTNNRINTFESHISASEEKGKNDTDDKKENPNSAVENNGDSGSGEENGSDYAAGSLEYEYGTYNDEEFVINLKKQGIDIDRLRKDSEEYNEWLKSHQNEYLTSKESYEQAALNLENYGIYDNVFGYISAPSIGMKLPIYLGANDDTMAYGAGHLCYTSLPIGGANTNVVLAGHTGYIGRWLFDDVDRLSVGDSVEIFTYLGKLHYEVTNVQNKAPEDGEHMFIEWGKEKLTLITCTPDGVGGFDRRVVECTRKS